jgi:serine/threonine protein kinase
MKIGSFLGGAVGMASVLGKLHQRGLVHKDVKPANILLNEATGQVRFTGFTIVSGSVRERQYLTLLRRSPARWPHGPEQR